MRYTASTQIADRIVMHEPVEAADPAAAAVQIGQRYAHDVARSGYTSFDVEVRDERALVVVRVFAHPRTVVCFDAVTL